MSVSKIGIAARSEWLNELILQRDFDKCMVKENLMLSSSHIGIATKLQ